MKLKPWLAPAVLSLMVLGTTVAEEPINREVNWKIRREGLENSQVMRTLHYLTDIYGPRLTGSPNYQKSAEWVVKQLEEWGLENGHLEAWDFGHPGWLNERHSVYIVSPVKDTLVTEVVAWTPGTNGSVKASTVTIELPEEPTEDQLADYFSSIKSKVKGRIVMVGEPRHVPVTFNAPNKRREDSEIRSQFSAGGTPPQRPQRRPEPEEQDEDEDKPKPLTGREVNQRLDEFLAAAGAAMRVNDAGRAHGQIRAFNNRSFDVEKAVPSVVMRNEDYGRIFRIMADGTSVQLEFDIVNKHYPEGKTVVNPVGEIPGSDKADEVVMMGGHLDSWHAATGATDNGTGVTIMMEAMRILKALNVKPRRTIRIALWGGEEQGLLGSRAYVEKHFGTAEEPKMDHGKFAGYFNIDSGTGRARGASVFGPTEAGEIMREILAPFEDLGMLGAISTSSRRRGGSDHTSFNAAGLPGIGLRQDPIEYGSHTWHTNLDTYERVVEEDLQASAIIVAAAAYQLAMRDELLPRFSDEEMPKPVPDRNERQRRTSTSGSP